MEYSFGLTEDIVREISRSKNEPIWMLDKRLDAFSLYCQKPLPSFGTSLSGLNLDAVKYYKHAGIRESESWDGVPKEIYDVYEKLGIPKAEYEYLGGVGAQFDSTMVYHRVKESIKKQGVIFENMDTAVHEYPELVKKYFMNQCVPATDHKFAALHGAVWSGGTFIYVPKGVHVELPLQAYFRMNEPSSGQFEHTLIIADEGSSVHYIEGCSAPKYTQSSLHAGCVEIFVMKDAVVKYSSIENWSRNTYNLNTKKALVFENATIEWLSGNLGSAATMLYPSSILIGDSATSSSFGITFAGRGQVQDTGAKAVHIGKNTVSSIISRSISRQGGISCYRGFVKTLPSAEYASSHIRCDGLILDDISSSTTLPTVVDDSETSFLSHEAKTGKIGNDEIEYLLTKGYTKERAERVCVGGFVNDVFKKLPLEYAVELNKLIDLEMDGAF